MPRSFTLKVESTRFRRWRLINTCQMSRTRNEAPLLTVELKVDMNAANRHPAHRERPETAGSRTSARAHRSENRMRACNGRQGKCPSRAASQSRGQFSRCASTAQMVECFARTRSPGIREQGGAGPTNSLCSTSYSNRETYHESPISIRGRRYYHRTLGLGLFRGSAGVLGKAIEMFQA